VRLSLGGGERMRQRACVRGGRESRALLLRRPAPFLLVAIVALGGFLRVHRIGAQGLWLDEAFSVWLGRQPVRQMLGWLVRIDQHPPLYYGILHLWMRLGDGEAVVRGLSALCGTLTIPVMYLLGRRLADDGVGLLAALILAVSPFHVRFAQETRMYALLALNASLALYALVRLSADRRAAEMPLGRQFVDAWRSRRTTRHPRLSLRAIETDLAWLGYVVFTTATLLSHNTAVSFPLAANLFVMGLYALQVSGSRFQVSRSPNLKPETLKPETISAVAGYRSQVSGSRNLKPETLKPGTSLFLRNWLLAQAAVFLLWSPWLPAFVAQSAGVYREFWLPPPTWQTVVETLGAFLSAFLPLPLPMSVAVWGGYAALIWGGLLHFRRHPARLGVLLVTLLVPFVGELLVSVHRPIFYERTLIWASLPLYLLLAAGLRRVRAWPWRVAALLIMLAVNGLSLREYYVHFEKEQWDDAAAFVAQRVQPGDLILFNATWVQIPFDYYFRAYDREVVEHGLPVDLFDRGVLEPKMARSDLPRLREIVRGYERVWLVYSHDWYTDPDGLIPPALEEQFDLVERRRFYGLQVLLYGGQRGDARTE